MELLSHNAIVREISELIEMGVFPVGSKVFSEAELVRTFSVSRSEAKKILDDLCIGGYVRTEQGRGTFVQQRKISQDFGETMGLGKWLRLNNRTPNSKILYNMVVDPPMSVKLALRLKEGEKAVKIYRLIQVDGKPAMINEVYYSYERFPKLELLDLNNVSLYEYLNRHEHIVVSRTDENVEITTLDAEEASYLGQRKNAAAFLMHRTSYDQYDDPLEYVNSLCRSDMFRFNFVHRRDLSKSMESR